MPVVRQLDDEFDRSPIRVSYVVASFNRRPYLEQAIANLREFVTAEDEVIVVDGGSTDGTPEMVANHRDLVTTFVSERDSSEAHAFNKAYYLARGRWIKPITDDDYYYPDAMRQLIAVAEAHPELDAIQCGGETWRNDPVGPQFLGFRRLAVQNPPPTDREIFLQASIGPGIIVRKRAAVRIGGFSPALVSIDGDQHCKLIEAGCQVRYLDVNLYRWYCHPHSGYRAERGIDRSNVLFQLRLKLWDHLCRWPPQRLAAAFDREAQRDVGAAVLFRALGRWWLSPLGASLAAVSWLWAVVEWVRGALRSAGPVLTVTETTPDHASRVFTGTLY